MPKKLQRISSPVAPTTIMIVEDNVFTQQLLAAILNWEEYRVHIVRSGEEALQQLPNIQPDLVLLDVGLPGIDGIQTCRQLMELADVPITLLTVESGEDIVVAGFEAGAADYVTKPFNPKVLLARIRASLRRSRMIYLNANVNGTMHRGTYFNFN